MHRSPSPAPFLPVPDADLDRLIAEDVSFGDLTTAALGKETVAGHPCVKNKVTMTAGDKQTQEFTVWNATDLKDFPVQIQTAAKEGSLLMRYSNIKFVKPDAAQFEPPTGYTAYTDIQQMMVAAMQKMMSRMGAPQ